MKERKMKKEHASENAILENWAINQNQNLGKLINPFLQ